MKQIAVAMALAALVAGATPVSQAAFDYNTSIDEISASPLTAYDTVYLGMPRRDFAANFSVLPDWTYSGSATSYQEQAERTGTFGRVTVTEGIVIFTANPSDTGKVLAFDNYFKTKDKKTAKEMYTRLVATVYSNMENFPVQQRRHAVTWQEGDVTIVVSSTRTADADGFYTVTIRRYNNQVLHE